MPPKGRFPRKTQSEQAATSAPGPSGARSLVDYIEQAGLPEPTSASALASVPLQADENESTWECSACTFANNPCLPYCELCDAPRLSVSAAAAPSVVNPNGNAWSNTNPVSGNSTALPPPPCPSSTVTPSAVPSKIRSGGRALSQREERELERERQGVKSSGSGAVHSNNYNSSSNIRPRGRSSSSGGSFEFADVSGVSSISASSTSNKLAHAATTPTTAGMNMTSSGMPLQPKPKVNRIEQISTKASEWLSSATAIEQPIGPPTSKPVHPSSSKRTEATSAAASAEAARKNEEEKGGVTLLASEAQSLAKKFDKSVTIGANNGGSGKNRSSDKAGNKTVKKSSNTSSSSSSISTAPVSVNNHLLANAGPQTVLMVAEKPSIALALAQALCPPGSKFDDSNSSNGFHTRSRTTPVFQFPGTFLGNKETMFRVSSVIGHVFSLDFPSQYKSWDATEPVDLFAAPVLKSESNPKAHIMDHLKQCAKGVDHLVLWLDCDREGENICFEVIECCLKAMKNKSMDCIYRAKFSAITRSDIEKAMATLGRPNADEAAAVDARQELDLKVGVAFSRYQTRFFQGRYAGLDAALLSYGPCQTPTLGFCVQRHDDIVNFVPKPYWTLDVSLNVRGHMIDLVWERGRVFDKESVVATEKILTAGSAVGGRSLDLDVLSVQESTKRKVRPLPLNTVEMLKLASKTLGMGPHSAMQAAERLYLLGMTSYPRTESTAYADSFDVAEVLSDQIQHPYWGSFARKLYNTVTSAIPQKDKRVAACFRRGVDVGDHPPITPCRMVRPEELASSGSDMSRLYELITRHFLAAASTDASYKVVNARLKNVVAPSSRGVGSISISSTATAIVEKHEDPQEFFRVSGRELIQEGFLEVLLHSSGSSSDTAVNSDDEDDADEEDDSDDRKYGHQRGSMQTLPPLRVGERIAVHTINTRESKTVPPGYLTESALISLMAKHGIGTDASIPSHINNVCERNYVSVGSGRRVIPTDLGVVLVHGYMLIDKDLVLPAVRASIENQCSLIAQGHASRDTVVSSALQLFEGKFRNFTSSIAKMEALFEATFAPSSASEGKPLSQCGKCKRYMKLISLRTMHLECAQCESKYDLPQGGTVKLYKGHKCPVDNFELVLFSLGNQAGKAGKTFPLCPKCYNNPPFEDIKAPMGCNSCANTSCQHAMLANAVCPCPGTPAVGSTSFASSFGAAAAAARTTTKYSASAVGDDSHSFGGQGRGRGAGWAGGGGRDNRDEWRADRNGRGRAGRHVKLGHDISSFSTSSSSSSTAAAAAAKKSNGPYGGNCSNGIDNNDDDDDDGDDAAAAADDDDDAKMVHCPGTMIIDVTSKPNWKLDCNMCSQLILLKGPIHNICVTPERRKCPACSSSLVVVQYHKDKTPLPNGATSLEGCLTCDEALNARTETKQGRLRHAKYSRRHRAGGRGRGRGGRGGRRDRGDPKMSFDRF